MAKKRPTKKSRKAKSQRPMSTKGSGKFIKHKGKLIELTDREAMGGGILSGYKGATRKSIPKGRRKGMELSEKEAAGGGIMSGFKKARKVAKVLRKDPLDALGISRRKFMKTRLGRRLLELSAKQLKKDFALVDDLIERFKETRS